MSGEARTNLTALAAEEGWTHTVFSRTDQFRLGAKMVELSWSGDLLSSSRLVMQSASVTVAASGAIEAQAEIVSIVRSWLANADPTS